MDLKDYVAVSGLPGLFKIVAPRGNGLVVEEIDSGKKKFVSMRKHQFTPLDSVGIFTYDDSTEMDQVFQNIVDQLETNPPVSTSAKNPELAEYFRKILPNYDEDRVSPGDIKKVIKWFHFLNDRNLLAGSSEEE